MRLLAQIAKKIRTVRDRVLPWTKDYSKYQRVIISKSPLFDPEFYRRSAQQAGVPVKNSDPIAHYLSIGDKRRIATHPLFDTFYYHDRYRDVEPSGMSALFHYLQYGALEFRDPHPLLNSKFIATQINLGSENPLIAYLRLPPGTVDPHPDIDEEYLAEQLKENGLLKSNALVDFLEDRTYSANPSRNFDVRSYARFHPDACSYHPFYHFVCFGRSEGRRYESLEDDVSGLLSQIDEISSLDVDIIPPHTDVTDLPKVRSISAAREVSSLLKVLQKISGGSRINHLFFVPHLVFGGAEKVLVNIVSVLSRDPRAEVLIIITDSSEEVAINWFPKRDNIKIANIYPFTKHVDRFDILQCLGIYLQTGRFDNVYSLNSKIGWDLFERYGLALSQLMKIHGFAFCYDFDIYGRRGGYAWTHLQHCIRFMETVITDNDPIVKVFGKELRLADSEIRKFRVLRQPVEIKANHVYDMQGFSQIDSRRTRPTVLWAGRFHKQKNVDCGLKIAALLPHIDFLFAGGSFNDLPDPSPEISANVTFLGLYDRFESLLDRRIDLFLHTADWDGLPNVLLEAASHGIPIVARDVGGVSDLVDSDTGWLLPQSAAEGDFATVVSSALSDQQALRGKVGAMTAKLHATHTWDIFSREVVKVLSEQEI